MNEAVLAERIPRAQKDTQEEDRANTRPTQGLGQTLGVTVDWLGIWENEVPLLGKERETHLEWEEPRNGVLEALGQGLTSWHPGGRLRGPGQASLQPVLGRRGETELKSMAWWGLQGCSGYF